MQLACSAHRVATRKIWVSILVRPVFALFALCFLASTAHPSFAQSAATPKELAERLQRGVDNPEQEKNKYRGGVDSFAEVKSNMQQLFTPILTPGQEADKWYSPHLRDDRFDEGNKGIQASVRARAGNRWLRPRFRWILFWGPCFDCRNGLGIGAPQTACDLCNALPCPWTVPWEDHHINRQCCFGRSGPHPPGTAQYASFTQPSNFKTCCVRKSDEQLSEEEIACKYPKGDGWAGLFEYYFPTTAIGWENDRTTTLLATKAEVKTCLGQSDKLMENQAPTSISDAIKRNVDAAEKTGASGGSTTPSAVNTSELAQKIAQDAKEVRPAQNLRFSDSLQGEGLTMRPNFAALDRSFRRDLATRFCMHPDQFMKLMSAEDLLQLNGSKHPEVLAKNIPIWSNYCPQGVDFMTKSDNSNLKNIDQTDTDFQKGMAAWNQDPLYCQRMNLSNPNMDKTGLGDAIRQSGKGAPAWTEAQVGYTCREGGKLNGGMVPVTLFRHSAVDRRTAIGDHVLGFLISGGLATTMRDGSRSFYKRFEPRPYTFQGQSEEFKIFKGNKFEGLGMNELLKPCTSLSGENYKEKNNSDQLYISDRTHRSFTDQPIINVGKDEDAFNKYRQEWAKSDEQLKKQIAKRETGSKQSEEFDRKLNNYAAAFRAFATCPAGYVRWRPPAGHATAGLISNLEQFCGEENFGSPVPHGAP
jgi:hypothetical protein